MLIAPAHFFTWDFWSITDRNQLHHFFFLQAPRDDYNPEGRHHMASVGHSVTRDFVSWEYRGTAIPRGNPGTWNDIAIWTGSVIKSQMGDYLMMVTGRSSRDGGRIQRLGLYFSHDLYSWTEFDGNPIIVCDPRLYETEHPVERWTTWRDPFLLYDDSTATYVALITAQQRGSLSDPVGTIGVARSTNGTEWTVESPLTLPPFFDVMECPQLVKIGDTYILLVHLDKRWVKDSAPSDVPRVSGSHFLFSKSLTGSYTYGGLLLDGGIDLSGGHLWNRYQLRIHDVVSSDRLRAFYWEGYQQDGSFKGGIGEPLLLEQSRFTSCNNT